MLVFACYPYSSCVFETHVIKNVRIYHWIHAEEDIKKESGEFDLESVFMIDLSKRGLISVGALPLCTQLCVLDLSRNNLTTLSALAVCTKLEWLDVSANQIAVLG